MLGEQNARRQPLVLAQAGWTVARKANSTGDLVVDDLGRNGNELTIVALSTDRDLGIHADGEIVGITLGNHRIDLVTGQVDDGHDGHIAGYGGFLVDEQIADNAVDGRLDRQVVDLPPQVVNDEFLRVDFELARTQFERQAFVVKVRIRGGVLEGEFGVLQVVLRLLVVNLGDHALLACLLGTPLLTASRDHGNLGEIGSLATLQRLLARFDALPIEVEPTLCEGGFGLLQLVGQLRAVDSGQHLARLDPLARLDVERDGPRSARIQRRADGRDDAPLDRHVADQIAPLDDGRPNAVVGHADRRAGPALHRWCGQHDQGNRRHGDTPDNQPLHHPPISFTGRPA